MTMRTVLNPTALLSITLLVTAGIGMDAMAAGRTYVPKNEDTTPKMETCRLKKSTQVEGNTQCQYRRQTGGKDVFLTIEMPNAACQREFQCKREK